MTAQTDPLTEIPAEAGGPDHHISAFPPGLTGRRGNDPIEVIRAYITIAPATPTLTQNRLGILTTNSHLSVISGLKEPRSGPIM